MDPLNFTAQLTPLQMQEFIEKQKEKSRLNKIAWMISLSGVVFFLVSRYISEILIFAGDALGVSRERLAEIFSDPVVLNMLQIVLSILLLTVPFILFFKILGEGNIGDLGGFNRPKKGTVIPHVMIGIGFCAFANIAVWFAGRIFENFGVHNNLTQDPPASNGFALAMTVISTAIVPAVVEEFAFRGIVLGALKPHGEAFALLASAAAFGILHGNFEQIPFGFLVGVVLGYIRLKSGSVAVCMAVHSLNNLVAVVLNNMRDVPNTVLGIIYSVYLALALLAAIAGVAMLKDEKKFVFDPPQRHLTPKENYVTFFFSPGFILFALLYLYKALTYVF